MTPLYPQILGFGGIKASCFLIIFWFPFPKHIGASKNLQKSNKNPSWPNLGPSWAQDGPKMGPSYTPNRSFLTSFFWSDFQMHFSRFRVNFNSHFGNFRNPKSNEKQKKNVWKMEPRRGESTTLSNILRNRCNTKIDKKLTSKSNYMLEACLNRSWLHFGSHLESKIELIN